MEILTSAYVCNPSLIFTLAQLTKVKNNQDQKNKISFAAARF